MDEVIVDIADLHPMAPPKAIEELSVILDEEGIENPIVILLTDKASWLEQKKQVPFILDPPDTEEPIMQIRCGTNRVEWLRRQGIKTVRALMYVDVMKAGEECLRQNKWHKQRHGPLI